VSIELQSVWTPHPKQALFLACPVFEVLYGGAAGPGKSDALLFDHVEQHNSVHSIWEQARKTTRGRALLVRKEFGRLKDLINRAHNAFPVLSAGSMRWRENEHTFHCACGYRFEFGHLEGPQDHQMYQGQEFTWLGFDQVEEIPQYQYDYLRARVRTSEPALQSFLKVRSTANPVGRYADWVKKYFVDPAPEGMTILTNNVELPDGETFKMERTFIPGTLADNPSLPRSYIANLMLLPEHLRRALINGDWNVTIGSFFGDVFDPSLHVVDDMGPTEIRIPSNWPVFRCADWGSRNPAACYWIAVDNDGLLIVLDELYGPGEEPTAWGKRILALEEKWGWVEAKPPFYSKLSGVLDPSCFKTDVQGGPTIAERLFEVGLSFFQADNERKAGWVEVRRRLMERGGISKKVPGLRICRRCVNLIRTLPNLTSPDKDAGGDQDDIDTKQEDHGADALRYGCMSRPRGRVESEINDEEIRRWERITLAQGLRSNAGRNATTGY